MKSSFGSRIVQIAFVVSGLFLALWLFKKISTPMLFVAVLAAWAVCMIWDVMIAQYEENTKTQLATMDTNLRIAESNERSSHTMLSVATEQKQKAKFAFWGTIIGSAAVVFRLAQGWLHHH